MNAKMKKSLSAVVSMMLASTAATALAVNTSGYYRVSEIKLFGDVGNVYFENGEAHTCSATTNTQRFLTNPAYPQQVTLLLAAFLSGREVQLAYNCNSQGDPVISGVRLH